VELYPFLSLFFLIIRLFLYISLAALWPSNGAGCPRIFLAGDDRRSSAFRPSREIDEGKPNPFSFQTPSSSGISPFCMAYEPLPLPPFIPFFVISPHPLPPLNDRKLLIFPPFFSPVTMQPRMNSLSLLCSWLRLLLL